MGQRAEVMITLGSQYYDAAYASIDYEWAVTITFESQACSLHHRLALCIIGLIALVQSSDRCSHIGIALNLLGLSDMGSFLIVVLKLSSYNDNYVGNLRTIKYFAIIEDLFVTREIRFN